MILTPHSRKDEASLPLPPTQLSLQEEGSDCCIVELLNAEAELTLLRFGLGIGDFVHVLSKVPNKGPIILEAHDMEFALGFDYASSILVVLDDAHE